MNLRLVAVAAVAMGARAVAMAAEPIAGGAVNTSGIIDTPKGPSFSTPVQEQAIQTQQEPDWITWHPGFFSTCDNNCAVTILGGREVTTSMQRIFIKDHLPPWKWKYGDGGFVGGTFSRRLVTFLKFIDVEPEFGIGKRFGDVSAVEIWGSLYFRWTYFPWNDYVKTTIGVNTGLNYATKIEVEERQRSAPGHRGSNVLHNFSPEMTFALPEIPNYEMVFRYHHRSGIYGAINGVYGGIQFATMGLRYRF